jgi:putative ABC transport system permease protein
VVNDFHFDLLTTPITGLLLEINPDQVAMLSMRFTGNDLVTFIDKIETQWNAHFPEKSFQYDFVDQQLAREYQSYEQMGKNIQLFTLIAIIIGALGVYGLVLFTVQRKVKEIGVRKL